MSLTSHLGRRGSPVARWFHAHFADTRWLVTEENRRIRGGTGPARCPMPPVKGSDTALVGTATDQILAAWLDPAQLAQGRVIQGAGHIDGLLSSAGGRPGAASEVARSALGRIAQLTQLASRPSGLDWEALARVAVVLARFEQTFRARGAVASSVVGELAGSDDPFELGALIAGPATLEDLCRVAEQALAMCADLPAAERMTLGPDFACSRLLGGADADVLADGVLLDLKTTGDTSPLSRCDLWQMLGYVLADTDDELEIEEVGFIWPRWRFRSRWRVEDLIAIVGGHETGVEALRRSFREMCEGLRPSR